MSRFSKIRELVTLANTLETEGRKLSHGESRTARFIEADEYRAKAEWLAGRLTDEEYGARLRDILDARQDSVE